MPTPPPPHDLRHWLAHIIRQERHAKHWRQEDLAHAAHLSHKYIGEIERADKNPTISTYEQILHALGLSLHDQNHTPPTPDPNRLLIDAAIILLAEAVKHTFSPQEQHMPHERRPSKFDHDIDISIAKEQARRKKISVRKDGSPSVGPARPSEGVPPPARTGRAGPRMRKPSRPSARTEDARSTGQTRRQLRPRAKRKGP